MAGFGKHGIYALPDYFRAFADVYGVIKHMTGLLKFAFSPLHFLAKMFFYIGKLGF